MADKVSTHMRFLRKAKRDLKTFYSRGDYKGYIERFDQYAGMTSPELEFIEKYYEALLKNNNEGIIVDTAMSAMNEDAGNYETHMYYMLISLLKQERYFEVIAFIDHLMEEEIPQGFRIELAALRHRAKKSLDDDSSAVTEELPKITGDDFNNKMHYEKLELLGEWTDEKNDHYRALIRNLVPVTDNNELLTFMLLFLREIGDRDAIEVNKFGVSHTIVPEHLQSIEEFELSSIVLYNVLSEVEYRMPELLEPARGMLMSHIIHCYPFAPDYNMEEITKAYLKILHDMVNLEYENQKEVDGNVVEWIRFMESSIAGDDGKNQ